MSVQTVDFVQYYLGEMMRAHPKAGEAFLEAYDAYATEITVAVTTAPPDQVLNKQGRAAETLSLLKLFRAAPKATTNPQTYQQRGQ